MSVVMGGTRALLGSIGASFSLVAAAALSLLVVSAVFAFGGFAKPLTQSDKQPALVFAAAPGARDAPTLAVQRAEPSRAPVVLRAAPTRRAAPRARVAAISKRPSRSTLQVPSAGAGLQPGTTAATTPPLSPPRRDVKPVPLPAIVPKARKTVADTVRSAGKDLSTTVQGAGTALVQATAPLSAPVSAAVQELLNLVAALLRRSTGSLGTALGGSAQ